MPALSAVMTLSIPLGLAFAGPLLSTAGAHSVLVGFAVTQTAAMALVSILGLRVRASRRADAVSVAA